MATQALPVEDKIAALQGLTAEEQAARELKKVRYLDAIADKAMALKDLMRELERQFPELGEVDSWCTALTQATRGEQKLLEVFGHSYATVRTNNRGSDPFESRVLARKNLRERRIEDQIHKEKASEQAEREKQARGATETTR